MHIPNNHAALPEKNGLDFHQRQYCIYNAIWEIEITTPS